jgi:predicted amidophosphoribosyltransferase
MLERYGNSYKGMINHVASTEPDQMGRIRKCPLCGSSLINNKRVNSVLFPGKPDSLMEINGCPYCYPANLEITRICPVCKKEVPKDGHVIARVFIKPNKKHVHVLGCTACYKRKV